MARRLLAGLGLLLFASVVCAPAAARAQSLYSVDFGTDELVAIDPATGHVRVVGPLGVDTWDVDLTALGGKLYAIDNHPYAYANLLEIDPLTGAATVLGPVATQLGPILNAEGLAQMGGTLYVGYAALGAHFASNEIGTLDLTGTVTEVFNFLTIMRDEDFDGLAAGLHGGLISIDNNVGIGVSIDRVSIGNPGTCELIGYTWWKADACCGRGEDLDWVGLKLYYSNGDDGSIVRVNPANGALIERIPLDRLPVGDYAGAAALDPAVAGGGTCEPLALGSWRRSCTATDPYGENPNLAGYATDIRAFEPFSALAGAADLCARLKPPNTKCAQAEAQFLALLLNVDSMRLGRDCCVAGGETVAAHFARIWTLLRNPARTQADCTAAQALADALNTATALCPPNPT